ncbi:type II secretion system F family protein [Candidatus Bathyarchaeota archaeon]|nr:type II secretion system F family protein [Candidatus Bathyarchaeota archaeon]
MPLENFSYAHFSWLGRGLSKIVRGIEHDLDAADIKMYHEVYLSLIGFISILSLSVPVAFTIILLIGFWPEMPFLPMNGLFLIPATIFLPLIILGIGVLMPKMSASNRVNGLKIEIPYASMYISVMTSGGLSPYQSLLRMQNMDLMPNMRKEVKRIEKIRLANGVDPLTAMEQAARVVNLNEYKELLLGYASSVRTGGDTLHYLYNQTHNMFRRMSTKVKSMGENMGVLMEAYTIVGILGVLGLFLIFVVGLSLPSASVGISPEQFFLFSFIILPVMSIVFIYFGDTIQISYPVSNFKTYMIAFATVPVAIVVASQTVLPFFDESFLVSPFLYEAIINLRVLLRLAEGTEAALGLAIALLIVAIPSFLADQYIMGRERSLQDGITTFLRDLVEIRKSGLNPERCIDALANRDYKSFSKHLKMINMKLNWGYPIREIYQEFKSKVRNWLALINVYLLIDTIEVGGGTEESLESLAEFAESTRELENEKKSALMPLTIVPYIGAALLTGSTVIFLQFFTSMGTLGVSVQTVTLYRILLTPLVLHSFILGLVTGKIVTGRVSAGFKHAIFLTLVALAGIYGVSNMSMGPLMGGF